MIDLSTAILVVSVAFLSSLGHCVGMCGGFLIAVSRFGRGFGILLGYNLFRILAYILLGGLFGAFGGLFVFSLKLKGYLFFVLGLFMIFLGIALIYRGSLLRFIEENKILSKPLTHKMSLILQKNGKFGFLFLGFLNGLLPCGVVYYFLAMAISSGSALGGMSIMAIFGMVSFLMMGVYSFLFKILNDKFKKTMLFLSSLLVIAYGIYLAFVGFMATNG